MLRACRDLRHGDADGAQQVGAAVEAESTQAGDVVECDIERVDALVAGRMAAFAAGFAVEDDQPPFADGGLHPRGLAHDCHVDPSQLRQQGAHTVLAHALLFGRKRQQEVERQGACAQRQEGLREAHRRSPGVVAPQAVEAVAFDGRGIRVAGVAGCGAYRVVVGVQEQRRARRVEACGAGENVVV